MEQKYICPGNFSQKEICLPTFLQHTYFLQGITEIKSKSKGNNILFTARKMRPHLCAVFWEEFTTLEMTILEKFPIFGKYSPLCSLGGF